MVRRAEQVDDTRRRIVEATVALHEEVGLSATTIAAVADAAGVTRLTVYRHFPQEADLFAACSAHWRSGQRLPDPDAWALVADPAERLRVGLNDLYRHYRSGEPMLRHVRAELDVLPEELRRRIEDTDRRYRAVLMSAFPRQERSQRLTAAIGHAISFWTWRSLCVDERLPRKDAVDLMVRLAMRARRRRR